MASRLHLLVLGLGIMFTLQLQQQIVAAAAAYMGGPWQSAHATMSVGDDGDGSMGGACGYGNLYSAGYDVEQTAALSTALFDDGRSCGACFEIINQQAQQQQQQAVRVTATSFCPPNYGGGWCNPPRAHFELPTAVFLRLAEYGAAGIIPVAYRRVACRRSGGIRFHINGFRYFNVVLITNVGGAGEVARASVKSGGEGWLPLARNWGQNWQCTSILVGGALSFRVTTADRRTITASNVAGPDWRFGQTFTASTNFLFT